MKQPKTNLPKNVEFNEPITKLKQIRKMVNKLEKLTDDTDITLTFVLTALFPRVWYNIQSYAHDCYTQGYLQARKEFLNETKGDN